MRELIYVAKGNVEWREAPDPRVQSSREAIVAPIAATACDVDSMILAGKGTLPPPFAIGREGVARVVDVGDDVRHVRRGDVVVVTWTICCGE